MFDCICITRPSMLDPNRLGVLAECLLFYHQVSLVIDHQEFKSLVRICGPETLLGLVEDGHLDLIYQENRLGVATRPRGGCEEHGFVALQGVGYSAQDFIPKLLQEVTGKAGKGRRLAKRFQEHVTTHNHDPLGAQALIADLMDAQYTNDVVTELLRVLIPGYPLRDVVFRLHEDGGSYFIESSINFAEATQTYSKLHPGETFTPALILSMLYEGAADLSFAANLSSEICTAPYETVLATQRLSRLAEQSNESAANRQLFQEYTLETRSIAEAVDSGARNFDDVRRLLDDAAKFKKWVVGKPQGADLLKAYIADCSQISWMQKLPNKFIRFMMFNSAGLAAGLTFGGLCGPTASLAISAVDFFLVDKLLSGWTPHQFVAEKLKPFVSDHCRHAKASVSQK
jgi:hypothetical protein